MTAMRFDEDMVAGSELAHPVFVFEAKSRGACQQQNPFHFVLVVPETGRGSLTGGNDAFRTHRAAPQQLEHLFVLGFGRRQAVGEEIVGMQIRRWSQPAGHSQQKTAPVTRP